MEKATLVVSVATHKTSAAYPVDPTKNPKEVWKPWIERRIHKPSLMALIALTVVSTVSFCPALLSNPNYLDSQVVEGPAIDPDGGGVRSTSHYGSQGD